MTVDKEFYERVRVKLADVLRDYEDEGLAESPIEPSVGGMTVREYIEYLMDQKWRQSK